MAHRATVAVALYSHLPDALFSADALARLDRCADVRWQPVITDWSARGVDEVLADATVLLTGWGCPRIDLAVLDRAPALTAIVHAAGTVKNVVDPRVWGRRVLVSSAAEANADPVAEFTVATVILAAKRTFRHADAYRLGNLPPHAARDDSGTNGSVVGVVGASRIGRKVLRGLRALDVRLLVTDPFLDPVGAAELGAELVDLDELCARADIVTLHAPSLPSTRHLLDDSRLALLRDGAIVINTARGALIDTAALTRHCAAGRIDAVLDVTDPEPLPAGHPLFGMPNVLLTPHLAGARGNELRRLGGYAVSEIDRLVRGERLLGLVSAHDLERIA
ncbi:dehydrogenase [Longispora fulva]|uniref:Phosphoglycerate dehydrogenase-like enzyme n=1 Tax=Longispora fulva TaxID=619741 RepID=A0A8J7G549_9ACTN|nr:hydroxyacid dehydrogenase [Longispora fulva]MBG6133848.1 phosphoglycerate dehydrogenase-like enzyme [Longispora fulva]GIG62887.1 dehydrogenase [Longispora fulva]